MPRGRACWQPHAPWTTPHARAQCWLPSTRSRLTRSYSHFSRLFCAADVLGRLVGIQRGPARPTPTAVLPALRETPGAGPAKLKKILHASLHDTDLGVGPEEGHQLPRVPSSWGWQCWRRAGLSGDDLLRLLGLVHSLFLHVTSAY